MLELRALLLAGLVEGEDVLGERGDRPVELADALLEDRLALGLGGLLREIQKEI